MKRSILFLFSLIQIAFAQSPTPESPLKFLFKTSAETVQGKITEQRKTYSLTDWTAVEASVRKNNSSVEAQIQEIDLKAQTIYTQLKKLQAANNIIELQANLDALKDARKKILSTTEQQLQSINFRCLFIGICSQIDPFAAEKDHLQKIREAIAPDAISTLNGAFIESITELKDYKVEYDFIREKVSGSMEPEGSEYEDRNFSEGYFLQIRQEKVYPLMQKVNNIGLGTARPANVKVIDLVNNTGYATELNYITDAALRQRVMSFIEDKRTTLVADIERYNNNMREQEKIIAKEAKEKLDEQDAKIKAAEKELVTNTENAKNILKEIGVNFNINNLKGCLGEAEKILTGKLATFNNEKSLAKSNELIAQVFDVAAQSGLPAQDLAQNAVTKVGVINQANSQVKGFLREVTMKNGAIESYNAATAADVYREVDNYWAYPIPNGGSFKMGVVAKFKITGKNTITQPTIEPTPKPKPTPVTPNPAPAPKPRPRFDEANPKNQGASNEFDKAVNPDMIFVEGGSFSMGDIFGNGLAEEKPAHNVMLSSYYISKYEITVAEFATFIGETHYVTDAESNGRNKSWRHDEEGNLRTQAAWNFPVMYVSWNDAVAYCKWLSTKSQFNYRLPTEAEWEFAARSRGKKEKWAGTSDANITKVFANFIEGDPFKYAAPVGTFSPNELDIYDMSGNVAEWCSDYYSTDYYKTGTTTNPQGPATGVSFNRWGAPTSVQGNVSTAERVVRGGSATSNPESAKTFSRSHSVQNYTNSNVGFRIVRNMN